MRRTVPLILVGAFLAPLALAGCEHIVDQRGFAATPGSVDKIEIGTQSREDIVRLVGSPSAVATFNPNVWYYISAKQEYWGPSKPWITEQSVIQITFDESGRVQTIKYYDLADAQNITMVSRASAESASLFAKSIVVYPFSESKCSVSNFLTSTAA